MVKSYTQTLRRVRATQFLLPLPSAPSVPLECQLSVGGHYQLTLYHGDWIVYDEQGNLNVFKDAEFQRYHEPVED